MRWQMAPLTSSACPNQELMVLEVSAGLLVLKDTLQKLLLFSPSYLHPLSHSAVLTQEPKASHKLCGESKSVSLKGWQIERGVTVVFQTYRCRGEIKVSPHVKDITVCNLGVAAAWAESGYMVRLCSTQGSSPKDKGLESSSRVTGFYSQLFREVNSQRVP